MILAGKSPFVIHSVAQQFSQHPRPEHEADANLQEGTIYSQLLETIMGIHGQEALESLGLEQDHSPLERAERIIESVVRYPSDEVWMEQLRAQVLQTAKRLSADGNLSPENRRALILILNEHFTLKSEDATELRLLKVQSIIKETWDRWIDVEKLAPEERVDLFNSLLSTIQIGATEDALISVLQEWTLESAAGMSTCWSQMFGWMIEHEQFGKIFSLRLKQCNQALNVLDDDAEDDLLRRLDAHPVEAMRHGLLSKRLDIKRAALKRMDQVNLSHDRPLQLLLLANVDLFEALIVHPIWPTLRQTLMTPENGNADLHRSLLSKWVLCLKQSGRLGAAASLGLAYLNRRGASRFLGQEGIRGLFSLADHVAARLPNEIGTEVGHGLESEILTALAK
jgi:hypothetical protein